MPSSTCICPLGSLSRLMVWCPSGSVQSLIHVPKQIICLWSDLRYEHLHMALSPWSVQAALRGECPDFYLSSPGPSCLGCLSVRTKVDYLSYNNDTVHLLWHTVTTVFLYITIRHIVFKMMKGERSWRAKDCNSQWGNYKGLQTELLWMEIGACQGNTCKENQQALLTTKVT